MKAAAAILSAVALSCVSGAASPAGGLDALYAGFLSPPDECRPDIWLFCLGENTPDEVVTYDFEKLAGVGIGGVCVYGYGSTTRQAAYGHMALRGRPKLVAKLRWALREARRLNLELSICIGPAGCGNELTTPDNAQKKLVFSNGEVDGGGCVTIALPRSKVPDSPAGDDGLPKHWHDIGVYAIRVNAGVAAPETLLDVSRHFDATADALVWDAPPGRWKVVRVAWTPKMFGWVGSYIDPLSRAALDEHWANCVQPLIDAATPEERAAFKGVMCDSWEAGVVDWTQDFPDEFRRRRGYDVALALVARAGIGADVGGPERQATLVRDFDKTIGELFTENHYAYQCELAHRFGMVSESEACGPHQRQGDVRQMQGACDRCTGEFWMPSPHRQTPPQRFMLRDCATAAHVYGKAEVRAESFTTIGTHWAETPAMLKPCADRAFCDGLTHIVWHGMLMSDPPETLPGNTRRAGAYYSPKVTWFPYSAPLNRYLARCSWMLSQGRFAADCLVYVGEAVGVMAGLKTPADGLGPGYDYDFCPTDVLLSAKMVDGEIVLPSGMRYKTLFLSDKNPRSSRMLPLEMNRDACDDPVRHVLAPEARRKVDELKAAGATVFETRQEMEEWLRSGALPPDFAYSDVGSADPGRLVPDGDIDWIHRVLPEGDVYFVSNQSNGVRRIVAHFRTGRRGHGFHAEVWDAVTGERRAAESVWRSGRAQVVIELPPGGSVFAVFGNGMNSATSATPRAQGADGIELRDGWEVSFDARRGGPEKPVAFTTLYDWTASTNASIRFYSGTARYRISFDAPALAGRSATVDLGEVHDVAEAVLNGETLGVAWTPPFRVSGGRLRAVGNVLEVAVANRWANRLIYDAGLPEARRVTVTDANPYTMSDRPFPSGLQGPVRVASGPDGCGRRARFATRLGEAVPHESAGSTGF